MCLHIVELYFAFVALGVNVPKMGFFYIKIRLTLIMSVAA